jgi:pimeloyl-ACP methyl ester carboxylesterase
VGCLVRFLGGALLLLVAAIGARRILERPAPIPAPVSGEKDFVVDGVRWRSREIPGKGTPIVYVHGLLSTSASWKRALEQASAGHPAIAVDLPGFGFSDRPWPYDYTVAGQAEALLRYLDARELDSVVLVGNSLGGAVCLVAAAARPSRVAALVLVGSASPVSEVPWNFRLLRAPVIGELEMELLIRPVQEFALRYRLFARPERVTQEEVDEDWVPIRVAGTRRAALAAIRSSARGFEGLLSRIRVPTLVLWGKEDKILPSQEGLRLASQIPTARLVVLPDTGHLPQEETPEEFSRAVSGFLREVLPGQVTGRSSRDSETFRVAQSW